MIAPDWVLRVSEIVVLVCGVVVSGLCFAMGCMILYSVFSK